MEIQALKLLISEKELNGVLARETAAGSAVRDVVVRFSADGIHVKGKYHMVMPMPFETLWQVEVEGGHIVAHLADIKVVGFAAAMLKGVLMSVIAESIQADGALQTRGDTLRIDVDRLLAQRGFPARTNLKSVSYEDGKLLIESALMGADKPGE